MSQKSCTFASQRLNDMKKLLLSALMCLMALSMTAQNAPYVIYDYLKVFPNDLGTFDAEPKTIIARLNQNQQYGYGTWRLPTNEELALMKANNIIADESYMTRENKKGIVRLVTDREKGETLSPIPQGYVDLGLPSGTLWKEENETGGLYTYDQALAKFGNDLPTKDQYEELLSSCRWTWIENGYLGEGPNGETITLLAAGYRDCGDSVSSVNDICSTGIYWSSTPDKSEYAWGLYLDSFGVGIFYGNRCNAQSVRLVR